ncbi:unnamed protein product [Knipowitschia caucasica]
MSRKKAGPSPEEFEDIKTSESTDTASVFTGAGEHPSSPERRERPWRIEVLEQRVDDLEQYSRINNLIVTGIKIKPRQFARAVAPDAVSGLPSEEEVRSVEQQVASFLQAKGIEMGLEHVEACHPLPSRTTERPAAVILRFVNRKHKVALLKQGRKLKGTNVFINEHLTKRNADIARRARQLKKMQKIQHTWESNCKIYIKLNGSPEDARMLVVRKTEELDKFM